MGFLLKEYLDDKQRVFVCYRCQTHLTCYEDLVSQAFQGHHGRAWLFKQVVNVKPGSAEQRQLTTGLHVVRDIKCCDCNTVLGWKYDKAFRESEKYKENKFILERNLVREVSTVDVENQPILP